MKGFSTLLSALQSDSVEAILKCYKFPQGINMDNGSYIYWTFMNEETSPKVIKINKSIRV